MRCFIAIDLPTLVKDHLWQFSLNLQKRYKNHKITWVKKEVLHLNLEFLGDLTPSKLRLCQEILISELRKFAKRPVSIKLVSYGAFPSLKRARILFIKAVSGSDLKIKDIQRDLHNQLLNHGFQLTNRVWRPHVTLGRVKVKNLRLSSQEMEFAPIDFQLKTISLLKSQLTPAGPIYTPLYIFNF